jgi:hypothetical protein
VTVGPETARKTWRTLEPLHGMIYFTPEALDCYAEVGVTDWRMGYFASRSAAMGKVPATTVVATYYNFNPEVVGRAIPAVWGQTTPEDLLDARLRAADTALRRALGDLMDSPELVDVAAMARQAAETACDHPEGRPLFAAHAALPWPDEPHLVLWHAQTLLREFRGDAHLAALLLEGLSGIEALVSHAASGEMPADVLRTTRSWSEGDWAAAVDSLQARGLLAPGDELAFTDEGREQRQRIEDGTDRASTVAYTPLGDDGCDRLRKLARPLSRAVVDAGLLVPSSRN